LDAELALKVQQLARIEQDLATDSGGAEPVSTL
jgi:hypothetical protein